MNLDDLETPCLLLDEARMERNLERLRRRMAELGTRLRPHLKTAKSIEVARRMMETPQGPATVSTLREAEQFAAAGVRDLLYAVGIEPRKLARVGRLRTTADVAVILDSVEQAEAVAAYGRASGDRLPALIEIDCDGHRAGVGPENRELLLELARRLGGGAELRGVMTHAGGSYQARGPEALAAAAEAERAAVAGAAAALRAGGYPCPVVSVGSTPTAHFARDLTGVTEVRAGVYVFFDLVMAELGVCGLEDIAISVLATVIGHHRAKGWTLVDAGWMAMSRDRGEHGYGAVCDLQGQLIGNLAMREANQEHGIVTGSGLELAVGTRVRILPNHACATAAQFDRYRVVGPEGAVAGEWARFGGW